MLAEALAEFTSLASALALVEALADVLELAIPDSSSDVSVLFDASVDALSLTAVDACKCTI